PASPTKFSIDNGSTKGVQTPIRTNRFVVTFSLILSTLEWVLKKMTEMFHPGPFGLWIDEQEASIDQRLARIPYDGRGLAKGSLLVSAHGEYFRKRGCIRGPMNGANLLLQNVCWGVK
nr:hypothetical protein [Tanacetum cinerariifolium]